MGVNSFFKEKKEGRKFSENGRCCISNRNRYLVRLIQLICLGVLLSGQSATVKIFGDVKNRDGEYLPGVTVTATHIESNANTTTVTGEKGIFRFLALDPGSYQVSFDLEGYQSYVVSGIRLSVEQSVNLRIKLKKKN